MTVKRTNMTRPRIRLQEGVDPSAQIEKLYGMKQGEGVRLNRAGQLRGNPTGFTGETDEFQPPQSPENRRGPNYSNDVPLDWRRGNQAEDRVGFDHSTPKASPFSKAGRTKR